MARTFCKTWWGNAWLQALSHIDYSNRIPRGSQWVGKECCLRWQQD